MLYIGHIIKIRFTTISVFQHPQEALKPILHGYRVLLYIRRYTHIQSKVWEWIWFSDCSGFAQQATYTYSKHVSCPDRLPFLSMRCLLELLFLHSKEILAKCLPTAQSETQLLCATWFFLWKTPFHRKYYAHTVYISSVLCANTVPERATYVS